MLLTKKKKWKRNMFGGYQNYCYGGLRCLTYDPHGNGKSGVGSESGVSGKTRAEAISFQVLYR